MTAISVATFDGAGRRSTGSCHGEDQHQQERRTESASLDTAIFMAAGIADGHHQRRAGACRWLWSKGLSSVMLNVPPFPRSAASQSSPGRAVYEYSVEGLSVSAIKIGAAYAAEALQGARCVARK
jgi:predicted phosphoribosyltransferase